MLFGYYISEWLLFIELNTVMHSYGTYPLLLRLSFPQFLISKSPPLRKNVYQKGINRALYTAIKIPKIERNVKFFQRLLGWLAWNTHE